MAKALTTKDLIMAVRSQLDEDNTASIDDDRDVIPALNRGFSKAYSVLARRYPDPLLTSVTFSPTANQEDYDIPEDAFEDRVEKIETIQNGSVFPVRRVDFRDLLYFETQGSANSPLAWASIGRTYRVAPKPTGNYQFRVWYLKEPPKLGLEQGRITGVNVTANYVTVDVAGESLESAIDSNNAYVNVIDKDTGVVKSSHQIQNIVGNRLLFRAIPSRSEVYGQTIAPTIPETVQLDDYICLVTDTCISPLRNPLANYVIQFAIAELTRKLGGETDMEMRVLDQMEKDVERQWSGRENTSRVRNTSKNWMNRASRWRVTWNS